MKKLLIIATAILLSACSTSNQLSLTKSRYGNGIGLSFEKGMTKVEKEKADQKLKVIKEKLETKKFLKSLNLDQRDLTSLNLNEKLSSMEGNSQDAIEKSSNGNIDLALTKSNTKLPKNVKNIMNSNKITIVNTPTKSNKIAAISKNISNKARKRSNGLLDDTNTLLLIILALILPPLAVYLYEGSWTSRCTLNLILTLLCGIPGVIHALIVILGNK